MSRARDWRDLLVALALVIGLALPSAPGQLAKAAPPARPNPDPCELLCTVTVDGPTSTVVSAAMLPTGFQDSVVLTGLTNPTSVRFAPDGRVFVAEKSGIIKVFPSLSDGTSTIFADLSTEVYNFWDRGLLGLALDPNFPTAPYVYVLYTYDATIHGSAPLWGTPGVLSDPCPTPPGANTDGCVVSARVSRLTASGNVITPGSEQVLIEDWCQQFPSHSIGSFSFGADGSLYVSGGEGGSFTNADFGQFGYPPNGSYYSANPCGDPTTEGGALRAQDLRTSGDPVGLSGAILRVNPATGLGQPTNPLAGSADPNARRIVAYGLRNPFRFAIRPGTNDLWIGDVGWGVWEEIDRVPDPTAGPLDFGWPCYEGNGHQAAYDAANLPICVDLYAQASSVTAPFYSYQHGVPVIQGESCPVGSSSISGLAFDLPGGSYPAGYDNALFFADYSRNCIWVMFAGANGLPDPSRVNTFIANAAAPVDLEIGPGNDLFYVDFTGGTIHRIQYSSPNPSDLALNQRITASSVEPNTIYIPSFAVDGDLTTRWSTEYADPQWIYVDLGRTQAIGSVRLTWETAYARAYAVQVSNDASTWTDVYATTTGDGSVDDITGLSVSGRYVRINGTVRATGWGYSLWEIEVYAPVGPTVSMVSPSSGPTAGGTPVTVTGTGFSTAPNGTTVNFGAATASSVSCSTLTSCVATSPPGSGAVDTTVVVGGLTSTISPADRFTYTDAPPPTVSGVIPSTGPSAGGTTVTITGTGFSTTPNATTVRFGTTQAGNVNCTSVTSCIATSPGGAGTVDVTATVGGITSATGAGDRFTYAAPTVTSVNPATGPASGGTVVTINGSGFATTLGETTAKFGATIATAVSCSSSTQCVATSPIGIGTVDVTVTVAGMTSPTSTADTFSYVGGPPSVTAVNPATGPAVGGTVVTITGTGFSATPGSTAVKFGGWPASAVTCASSTTCTATSPPGSGTIDITAIVTGVSSAPGPADQFVYTGAVNRALGRPTAASSIELTGLEASKAVDGDPTTRWSSAFSDPQWISVDLGSTYGISEVILHWETAYGSAYEVQVSNDAVTWTDLFSTSTGNGSVDDLTGLAGSGRYVRILGTARATVWGYSLYEIEIYGAPGPIVSTVSPSSGPPGGGTPVTVIGTGFSTASGATSVNFGAAPAPSVTCGTTTSCVATSPAGSGTVDVTVTVSGLTSAPTSADRFTYTGNLPPTATINAPLTSLTWKVGDSIAFSGVANDPEDGALPASALSWSLTLQHCPSDCHTHFLQSFVGVTGGSFVAPDHDYPSYLVLTLTATDSAGLTGTTSVAVFPQTVSLTFRSVPTGLQIVVGSYGTRATPFSQTVIVGSANQISAGSPQTVAGQTYQFVSWSDGATQTHTIVADTTVTYTATYRDVTPPVIANIRASGITSSAATIGWSTNEPADSRVEYGLTTAYGSTTALDPTLVTSHSMRLTGLRSRTTYHYRVISTDAAGNVTVSADLTFKTKA
jgi:glucose/arabinose dehydrogenase